MADPFEDALKAALAQPVGIAILCIDAQAADKLKRLLYVRRAKAQERGDSSFGVLSISFSPHSGEILYIYKRMNNADQPPTDEENDS